MLRAFGSAFKNASVDSVTIFSKCHHGVSYHPTEVGKMHPNLDFDLTRAQLDALHAKGINAPIYLTATWDELAAREHPEWRIVRPDGSLAEHRHGPEHTCGWAYLDFASPYLDYLCAQTEEVMQRYPDCDGIFMDISFQEPSVSEYAKAAMEASGLDWTDPDHRIRHTGHAVEAYFERVQAAVRKHDSNMPLFFNSGHMRRGMREHYKAYYTHLELESLPTAHWGYEHFPLSARYVEPLGIPFLGMTGKFHTLWGEVGGYKKPEALVYECGAMIAQGARCSIGDHLHPTASIDESTMGIIGAAFQWVADREAWCEQSVNRAEIALMSVEAAAGTSLVGIPGKSVAADEGAVRVMLESQLLFDVVDLESDLSPYALLILPDVVNVGPDLKSKIDAYVEKGGRVLLTGHSGIGPEGCLFDTGSTWSGTSENVGGDYALTIEELRPDFVSNPLFMYGAAEKLILKDGESLGEIYEPYFDRTPRRFSGHVNAPCKPDPEVHVAGSAKGAYVQFAFPIFTIYQRVGAVAMLEQAERLILKALGREPLLTAEMPRAGRATLRRQARESRDVLHLLCATPVLRGTVNGDNVQPIQDLIPLHDIAVSVSTDDRVSGVRLVPEGDALAFEQNAERVSFVVPRVVGHQMVEISLR